jgi:UDP-glucose 4-epimerase
MTWMVTGGAGYIGAHVVRALLGSGASVVVLDDLSTGERDRVDPAAAFVEGSVLDRGLVRRALREHAVTGVVHIAAKKQVGESMADPLLYYRENVEGLIALAESCQAKGVDRFVFSSSAATYGLPDVELVDEDTPGVPLSPYGESKLIGEWVLRHCERAYGMRAMNLRYFNVAGRHARARRHRRLQPRPDGLRAAAGRRAAAGVRRRLPDARTAPACATTCTSPTSPTPTWRPRAALEAARRARPTTSAAARAARCSTSCASSAR